MKIPDDVHESNFTILNNKLIRDRRISEALGLLVWMLSKPADYNATVLAVVNEFGMSQFKARKQFGILEQAGYVHRVRRMLPDRGNLSTVETIVYETPRTCPRKQDLEKINSPEIVAPGSSQHVGMRHVGGRRVGIQHVIGLSTKDLRIEDLSTKASSSGRAGRADPTANQDPKTTGRKMRESYPDDETPDVGQSPPLGDMRTPDEKFASARHEQPEPTRSSRPRGKRKSGSRQEPPGPARELVDRFVAGIKLHGYKESEVMLAAFGEMLTRAHRDGESWEDIRITIDHFVANPSRYMPSEPAVIWKVFLTRREEMRRMSNHQRRASGIAFAKDPYEGAMPARKRRTRPE